MTDSQTDIIRNNETYLFPSRPLSRYCYHIFHSRFLKDKKQGSETILRFTAGPSSLQQKTLFNVLRWTHISTYSNIYIYIYIYIYTYIQHDATLHSWFYLETALHVSGGTSTHHQEERKQLYLQHLVFVTPLLLPAAIEASSSSGVTNTRCCRYSCLRSWWWVEVPPETCKAVSR